MNPIFYVIDDRLVVEKLNLKHLEGNVMHSGNLEVVGSVKLNHDLNVSGSITVDTLNVKNLISENSGSTDAGQWVANLEDNLVNKGFTWTWGNGHVSLAYQRGNRLRVSGGNLDLEPSQSYCIDNTEVINLNSLGSTVVKSNLKEVGNLKSLNVVGDTLLGEFAYFNSGFGRLGINTDEPNGALSVVENNVEIVVGAPDYNLGKIGTFTTHDLAIVTDNTNRIVFKNNGKIIIGDSSSKTADVTIYGTLAVDTLVADTRIERFSSLEIKASKDTNIYGKGIIWTGGGDPRQLIILPNPDRLWSSESIDLAQDHSYFINARPVLSENTLGDSVVYSKLSTVGSLETLTVKGDANLLTDLKVTQTIYTSNIAVGNNEQSLSISGNKLNASSPLSIRVLEDEAFYADINEISVGNKNNTRKPVKLFGPVSVGVTTPDLDADFTVNGSVKFAGKKFITGAAEPTEGTYNKGDICWNTDPKLHSYVGWVCVNSGMPGNWIPFGAIGR